MKKRKPQPSPVGVGFRGNHEWAGWSWADAMRAMERNAERKMPDLKQLALRPPRGGEDTAAKLNYERSELTEGLQSVV